MPKKKKQRTVKRAPKKKRAGERRGRAPRSAKTSTEIVFSFGEIDFLRKITGKDSDGTTPKERKSRLSLRDKLLDINFSVPAAGAGGLIVLELAPGEVEFLQRITKEVYSFITAEERRARLILREKILIAVEKLTGRKIQPEEVAE